MGFFQDVLLKFGITGEAKVSKGIDSVTKSQKKLADETARKGKLDTAGAKSQDKASAALADYGDIASRVDSRLGVLVMSAEKLFKVGSDMAKLPLGEVLSKMTGKLKEFGGAFKFLGAAGVATAGVMILLGTIKKLNASLEASLKHIRDIDALQLTLAENTRKVEDAYRDAANAREGFEVQTQEQGIRGAQEAERLAKKTGMDAVTVGRVLGSVQGAGLSDLQKLQLLALTKAGRGTGVTPDMDEGSIRRAVMTGIEHGKRITSSEGMQRLFGTTRGTAKGAADPTNRAAKLDRAAFLKGMLGKGATEEDIQKALLIIDQMDGAPIESRAAFTSAEGLARGFMDRIAKFVGEEVPTQYMEQQVIEGKTANIEATAQEVRFAQFVQQALEQAKRQDEERQAAPTTVNNQPTFINYGPTAPSSAADDREMSEGVP